MFPRKEVNQKSRPASATKLTFPETCSALEYLCCVLTRGESMYKTNKRERRENLFSRDSKLTDSKPGVGGRRQGRYNETQTPHPHTLLILCHLIFVSIDRSCFLALQRVILFPLEVVCPCSVSKIGTVGLVSVLI